MSGEWETGQFDLPSYLTRIGYDGPLEPTAETLAGLHRAHVAAIPFENLDLLLGRGISVDLGRVQTKLVTNRRGGYCYEHGLLFAAALERLGYFVRRLLARIGDNQQRPRPRTHMTLLVDAEDGPWLADVGFGAGLLEPLPWNQAGKAHRQGGWTYQLLFRPGEAWQLRQRTDGGWSTLYSFTDEPQHAADIEMANHFTATHPSSPFVGHAVVMRKTAGTHRRLLDRRLATTSPDHHYLDTRPQSRPRCVPTRQPPIRRLSRSISCGTPDGKCAHSLT
jgi:N-hydroxyarylamine O-acetyltransferase